MLDTSRQIWNDSHTASGKLKAVMFAPVEVIVINPLRLTLGNIFVLKDQLHILSKWEKVGACAAIVFGTLYTMMLWGSGVMLLGKGIALLGTSTGLSPIVTVGEVVKSVGLKTFVAGGVPFYGLFYELPKQLYRVAPSVWRVVSEKVVAAAEWVFENILAPIWDKAIVPAANAIGKAYQFVADKLSVVLKPVANVISSTAKWVFHKVLTPIWNRALWPVLKAIGHACSYVAHAVGPALKAWADAVANAASIVFNKLFVPAGKAIAHAAVVTGNFLKQHVFDAVIVPAAREVQHGFIVLSNGISKMVHAA